MPTMTIPGINAMSEGGPGERRGLPGAIYQRSSKDGGCNICTPDDVNDQMIDSAELFRDRKDS